MMWVNLVLSSTLLGRIILIFLILVVIKRLITQYKDNNLSLFKTKSFLFLTSHISSK